MTDLDALVICGAVTAMGLAFLAIAAVIIGARAEQRSRQGKP